MHFLVEAWELEIPNNKFDNELSCSLDNFQELFCLKILRYLVVDLAKSLSTSFIAHFIVDAYLSCRIEIMFLVLDCVVLTCIALHCIEYTSLFQLESSLFTKIVCEEFWTAIYPIGGEPNKSGHQALTTNSVSPNPTNPHLPLLEVLI